MSYIPTPAAAPLPAAGPSSSGRYNSLKGRIRVMSSNPKGSGYLSLGLNKNGNHYVVKDFRDAMIVQITPAGRYHDVQIVVGYLNS